MLNRRQVLLASLAGAGGLLLPEVSRDGLALPFCSAAAPETPPRLRRRLEDFATVSDEVEALKRGVLVMKSRRPSDPTSWFFQAAIHGVSDAALAAAIEHDREVTPQLVETFWRKCPHRDADLSADFLVWHRAYLFYFERVLRAASGDPGFSLPYWNYLDKAQRRFPALFAFPDADQQGRARNPLYDKRRDPLTARLGIDYELNLVGPPSLDPFMPGALFGRVPTTSFGGALTPERSGSGYLESGLHDTVHRVIGGEHGLMGDSDTAAFDPVFWVHHTSIDRIWTVFDCLPSKGWGGPPHGAWMQEAPWVFYDAQTRSIRREPRAFFLHRANLGVGYDTDDPACHPLSDQPMPAVSGVAVAGGNARARLRSTASMDGMAMTNGIAVAAERIDGAPLRPAAPPATSLPRIALAADQPTVTTAAAAPSSPGANGLAAARPSGRHLAERRVYLDISNLALTRLPNVRYRVFVNLPGDQVTPGDMAAYVGTLAIFGVFSGGEAPGDAARLTTHGQHRLTQRFDITAQTAGSTDLSAIKVAVVPEALLNPIGSVPALPAEGDLSVGGFLIVVE